MKKILLLLLTLTLVFTSALFVSSCGGDKKSSKEELKASEGPEYTLLDDDTYEVSNIGSFTGTNLVIPDTYNGKPVTCIGFNAFLYCNSFTSITIPDSVTSIGMGAFSDCRSLTSVTMGNGVTSIGWGAFSNCHKLVEVINKSSLNITAGSEDCGYVGYYALYVHNGDSLIKTVGDYQFITYDNVNYLLNYLGNKSEITLPSNYNGKNYQIYDYAFYLNTKLTKVTIGNSVTSISDYAFAWCTSLTSVNIPDSITSIGDNAFYVCHKLVEVINKSNLNITAGSEDCGYVGYYAFYVHNGDSLIKTVGDYQFITYDNVNYLINYLGNESEITLPSNYNGKNYQIYDYAFYYNNLTRVTIPDSVTSIGEGAFESCWVLTSVTFKNTSGWYVTKNSSATSGTNVTVTNSSTNATYLTSTYCDYYWKRS